MGHGVTVTLDMLTVVLFMASILYCFCLVLAKRKLDALNRLSPSMSTKKLLILSAALVAVLRIMTILGVAAMNIANIRVHYSLKPTSHNDNNDSDSNSNRDNSNFDNQDFYDSAMTVLFDLPNCIVVSTYILLTLIWGECFLESRLHNENTTSWKKQLLICFMVFNTALYGTQLSMYGTVFFFSNQNTVVRTILYAAITGINFGSVVLVVVFYIYFNIRFSGFPFRSEQMRTSLSRISSVMTLWSVTRIVWGILALLVFVNDVELLQDSDTPIWSFLLLLCMFFVCEILPIIIMLDYSYLSMIGMDSSMNIVFQHEKQQQQQQLESLLFNNNNNNNNGYNNNIVIDTNNRERSDSVEVLAQAAGTAAAARTTASARTVRWEDQQQQQQLSPSKLLLQDV